MSKIPHVAEDILAGHPDRIADAVAERTVDHAVALDEDALVCVEVAVFRRTVAITGRIAAGKPEQASELFRESVVRDTFRAAGYHGRWAVLDSRFRGPVKHGELDPDDDTSPVVFCQLDPGPLSDEERAIRKFSDDQNIVVGHASGSAKTNWLPPAQFAVRRLRERLQALRHANPDVLGPDGKVLIRFIEDGDSYQWDFCNVALQHAEGVGFEALHRLVLPALEAEGNALDEALPGLGASWSAECVRLNGIGDFSCGGPHGDNGLSGKKLVVDHYGPSVPIGGGALCGKDPHKVDRVGALRARQLAVRLVRDAGAKSATVRLGYVPGLEAPAFVEADVDGEQWDEPCIRKAVAIPDLAIAQAFRDLELGEVRWETVIRQGYFGSGRAWER